MSRFTRKIENKTFAQIALEALMKASYGVTMYQDGIPFDKMALNGYTDSREDEEIVKQELARLEYIESAKNRSLVMFPLGLLKILGAGYHKIGVDFTKLSEEEFKKDVEEETKLLSMAKIGPKKIEAMRQLIDAKWASSEMLSIILHVVRKYV